MKAYIILLGRSIWASLNTYHAVLSEQDYIPDIIWIITEETYEENLNIVDEGLRIISAGFDFTPEIRSKVITEGDFLDAGDEVRELYDSLSPDFEVSFDITSARKALITGALLSTSDCKVEHVFYLMVDTLEDISKPYPMIPSIYQHLMDFQKARRNRSEY